MYFFYIYKYVLYLKQVFRTEKEVINHKFYFFFYKERNRSIWEVDSLPPLELLMALEPWDENPWTSDSL